MKSSVLVAYTTRYGSTQEVAEAVAGTLREHGLQIEVRDMRDVQTLDGYDAVVLGAALYMFHWPRTAIRFLKRHRAALAERPVAIFALGPVHEPHDDKEFGVSRTQLDNELAKLPWLEPIALELFGGVFDPAKLRFPLNVLAGQAPASDARDWNAIRAWASDLATKFQPALHEQEV
jgi:menaquinone-dependent protoporphyrinogen oxidase